MQVIPVERVFLDLANSRHEPYDEEDRVIEYLTQDEMVIALARDIAANGLNPLEVFALVKLPTKKGEKEKYVVVEGNRRICALKVLLDPDLAPAEYRSELEKLSKNGKKVSEVRAEIYNKKEDVQQWIDRLHQGLQNGIGRKNWSPDQKQRNNGSNKNRLAQNVLDYAENKGLITKDERKGILTTAQRFLSNVVFKDSLGIDNSNPDALSRNRPEAEFNTMIGRFVNDLANKNIDSRYNKEKIESYAHTLQALEGVTADRVAPEALPGEGAAGSTGKKDKAEKKPVKPRARTKLPFSEKVQVALKGIPNYKLETIYYSLCQISLNSHTLLLTVGLWSFIESLTGLCGRTPPTDFISFLTKHKLNKLGLGEDRKSKPLREAIVRISENGNTTKHDKKAASFNATQLANDMDTCEDLFIALASEAHNEAHKKRH